MPITHIHTYLVYPNKISDNRRQINGTSVMLNGQLFDLLQDIYTRSDEECDIDITFCPTADGRQQNDCRNLILEYLRNPTLQSGRMIANRLEQKTDGRSGLGLLFLIVGIEDGEHKIIISRFPTDVAIYVDEDLAAFTVEFLERVFIKNRASYKAVVYRDIALQAGFWMGRATDKQLNNRAGQVSNYWILDFLASQFTVTDAAGTLRLARAMREAATKSDIDVKQEINAAATLAGGLAGQALSINDFGERLGLSQEARAAINAEVKTPRMAEEQFRLDLVEFQRSIAFKSVELSNGGILTAPAAEFSEVFRQEPVDEEERRIRFMTEGRIVNERLKSTA